MDSIGFNVLPWAIAIDSIHFKVKKWLKWSMFQWRQVQQTSLIPDISSSCFIERIEETEMMKKKDE